MTQPDRPPMTEADMRPSQLLALARRHEEDGSFHHREARRLEELARARLAEGLSRRRSALTPKTEDRGDER